MKVKKGALGPVIAVVLVASLGAFTSIGLADTDYHADYAPTTLGNDYDNYIDTVNDYVIEGIDAAMPISQQNTENLETAKGLSISMGTESDEATAIILTNKTGKDIEELAVKITSDKDYPSNMLSAALPDDGQACWYFTFPGYQTHEYTNESGVTIVMPENYTLRAKFSDGTQGVFHNVNMNGVRTLTLNYSPTYKVYFVERTTITNHTPDPNLYYEINMAEGEEGGGDALNYHVNSSGRMGDRMITENRGGGWELSHEPTQTLENYALALPLYGEPSGEYTNGVYESLYWNAEELRWRDFDFE